MRLKNIVLPIIGSMMIAGSTLYASGNVQGRIMTSLKKIDLQKNQESQIQKFQEEQKKEIQDLRTQLPKGRIFSKDGFNKEIYIEKNEAAAKIRIEAEAKFIQKTFGILTNKQKMELLKALRAKN